MKNRMIGIKKLSENAMVVRMTRRSVPVGQRRDGTVQTYVLELLNSLLRKSLGCVHSDNTEKRSGRFVGGQQVTWVSRTQGGSLV